MTAFTNQVESQLFSQLTKLTRMVIHFLAINLELILRDLEKYLTYALNGKLETVCRIWEKISSSNLMKEAMMDSRA